MFSYNTLQNTPLCNSKLSWCLYFIYIGPCTSFSYTLPWRKNLQNPYYYEFWPGLMRNRYLRFITAQHFIQARPSSVLQISRFHVDSWNFLPFKIQGKVWTSVVNLQPHLALCFFTSYHWFNLFKTCPWWELSSIILHNKGPYLWWLLNPFMLKSCMIFIQHNRNVNCKWANGLPADDIPTHHPAISQFANYCTAWCPPGVMQNYGQCLPSLLRYNNNSSEAAANYHAMAVFSCFRL